MDGMIYLLAMLLLSAGAFACVSLTNIPNFCGTNAGGTDTYIYAILASDVIAIPAATNGDITTNISLVATKAWARWYITEDTGGIVSEPAGEMDGKSYNNTYTGFTPKLSAAMNKLLGDTNNGSYLFLIPDRNGNLWLLGDLGRPAKIAVSGNTGENADARNGYTLTITSRSAGLPLKYSATVSVVS